jgi:AraC-like DNA-binding protein
LERYQHSRHRTVVEQGAERCLDLRHVARDGTAPTAPEDLLVAGVLAGFLSAQGCKAVSLLLLAERGDPVLLVEQGRFIGPALGWDHRATDRWHLSWAADPPPRLPVPQGEEELGLLDQPRLGPTSRRVLARIAADPPHRFTLAGLATELKCSSRTLQRRLKDDSLSLSEAVALARLREAARLLAGSALPITHIGFVAGYSDAAHFARAFKAATAMSPSEYPAARTPLTILPVVQKVS